MHKTKLAKTQNQAQAITSFYFEKPDDFHYVAGQFIEVTLDHDNPDDRGIKRWFTLSSSPHEDQLAITTKFSVQNGSSFKTALGKLQPGQSFLISDAMGDFVLPKDPARPLLMVAGGIGITPVRSMLSWLTSQKQNRDITLLYGVNIQQEIAFKDLLQNQSKLEIIVQNDSGWKGKSGILNSPMIYPEIKKDHLVYLSGPEQMIEQLVHDLKLAGTSPNQLVTDYFPGYINF